MKNNLKKRPIKGSAQAYERFLKAMEKEVREKITDLETRLAQQYPQTNLDSLILQAGIGHLKEILGDSEEKPQLTATITVSKQLAEALQRERVDVESTLWESLENEEDT